MRLRIFIRVSVSYSYYNLLIFIIIIINNSFVISFLVRLLKVSFVKILVEKFDDLDFGFDKIIIGDNVYGNFFIYLMRNKETY